MVCLRGAESIFFCNTRLFRTETETKILVGSFIAFKWKCLLLSNGGANPKTLVPVELLSIYFTLLHTCMKDTRNKYWLNLYDFWHDVIFLTPYYFVDPASVNPSFLSGKVKQMATSSNFCIVWNMMIQTFDIVSRSTSVHRFNWVILWFGFEYQKHIWGWYHKLY